ncbi:MAG: radical SAM protein [Acidobacteria bacterium]|nr:radical SAM protein [Acidobacteriota bacterium]
MPRQMPLFEEPLTTRGVAAIVRIAGVEGLPSAERRADNAHYQEVVCRSALNRVKGMAFRWTLNPYRGCTHACEYCYARRYQSQLEMGAGDEFSSYIFVKRNVADVLARQLHAPSWRCELVALGTATDPYQPIEGRYRLTRACLAHLDAANTPVGLVTKGPMVVRDADVLARMSQRGLARVYVSVPTVDPVWEQLEPGTAPPMQRLRAVRHLRDAGVTAGVLMSPLVPGFTTHPSRIAATLQAMADLDVPLLGGNVLHLEDASREHFFQFLEAQAPQLLERYARLYVRKYPDPAYAKQVKAVLTLLRDRYEPSATP